MTRCWPAWTLIETPETPPDGHQARQEDRRDPKSAAARKPAAAAPAAKKTPAPKKAAAVKAPAKKTAAVKRAEEAGPAKSAEAVRAETIARKSLRKPSAPGVEELKFGIESAFERRATLTLHELEGSTRPLVNRVIDGLESGEFRVAEPDGQVAGRSTSG
jgi:2,3,4,5-tetrahydropyridine-2-carboxylate N-succinyltransferase